MEFDECESWPGSLRLPSLFAIANIRDSSRSGFRDVATLYIIDQSLKQSGGHHFDYTRLIARAATDRGLSTVVGVHRDVKSDVVQELAETAAVNVRNVFRETTYSPLSHLTGLRQLVDPNAETDKDHDQQAGKASRFRRFLNRRAWKKRIHKRSRLIRMFAEDCETFFKSFSFDDLDQVFFTTLSELELMGLTAFLSNHPRTLQASWHVQFHFSMFGGRPDEFDKQTGVQSRIHNCFQSALSRVPYHDLRAYTTSEELSRQYNRLRLIQFTPLPYPINPELFDVPSDPDPSGLRLTVAGGIRREKGQKQKLSQLVEGIWDRHIETGNLSLNIQARDSRQIKLRQTSRHPAGGQAIRFHRHPLPEREYVELIHQSDIGLFCYDSRRYYSRRAGILGEFLAAGKPVIVPAGCWLSQQIAAPVCQHIEELIRQAGHSTTATLTELEWEKSNVPLAGGAISFNRERNPFKCRIPAECLDNSPAGLAMKFRWQWPLETGSFAEIEQISFDATDSAIGSEKQIVTARGEEAESLLFFRIPPGTCRVELVFRNAWIDSSISITGLSLEFLRFEQNENPPRSAVGVIAADEQSLEAAIDEMVTHYDHYRRTAEAFSRSWSAAHDPARTVNCLVADLNRLRRAA